MPDVRFLSIGYLCLCHFLASHAVISPFIYQINEEFRPSAAGSSSPAHASSSSLSRPISCSQVSLDLSLAKSLSPCGGQTSCCAEPPVQETPRGKQSPCEGGLQRDKQNPLADSGSADEREDSIALAERETCPCLSLYDLDKDLIPHLSVLIQQAVNQPKGLVGEAKNKWEPRHSQLCSTEDGYFEMGADTENETSDGNCVDSASCRIIEVVWGVCFHSRGAVLLRHFASCLVLTDTSMACFEIAHNTMTPIPPAHNLLKLLLYFSYSDITQFHFPLPDICLNLTLGDGEDRVLVLSDLQNLQQLHACLRAQCPPMETSPKLILHSEHKSLQDFLLSHSHVQQSLLKDSEVRGCFPAYLFHSEEQPANEFTQLELPVVSWPPASSCSALLSSSVSTAGGLEMLPSWLLLTDQCLILITTDIGGITGQQLEESTRNAVRMEAIPLASVVLELDTCPAEKKPSLPDGHTVPLIVGYRAVQAFFVLPQNKFQFLMLFNQLRKSLQDGKNLVLCKSLKSLDNPESSLLGASTMPKHTLSPVRPHRAAPSLYPSESLIHSLSEENHIPFYLPALDSLHFIAELKGAALVELFRSSIAQAEGEELRHLSWASLLFYGSPDVELTSCIFLSTQAVYFLLDDSQKPSKEDFWSKRPECGSFLISFCLAIPLSHFHSVNIGLFDQYFRITGSCPSQVVTCLTRDSYCTHSFIQQLMSVLSQLTRTPSPEPTEKDFYSEFGKKNTGKMENYELVHSSRVKFVYPNDEEIGDLTFIVSEKMDPSSSIQSLNILLYVLGFQVSSVAENSRAPSLQPKSLILTSSDLFLFNEDYISYPLPDFAKEPPKQDKYQLVDGRRIRDLDRVLLGYQTYPQNLTFVFDDVKNQDFMHSVSLDHFGETLQRQNSPTSSGATQEIQWNIFIPSADSREKLISLLARQWEILCGRELPIELTG